MSASKLPEIGCVVKLKGSSTRMVVHDIDTDHPDAPVEGEVVCRWFNDSDELQEARFKHVELVSVG